MLDLPNILLGFFAFPIVLVTLAVVYVLWLAYKPRIELIRLDGVHPSRVLGWNTTRTYFVYGAVGTILMFEWHGPEFLGHFQVTGGRLRQLSDDKPNTPLSTFAVKPGAAFEVERNTRSSDVKHVLSGFKARAFGFFLAGGCSSPNLNQNEIDAHEAAERVLDLARQDKYKADLAAILARAKTEK